MPQDKNSIAGRRCKPKVMRDQNRRNAAGLSQASDIGDKAISHRRIQGGGRLVQDQEIGRRSRGKSEQCALQHTPTPLVRPRVHRSSRISDAESFKPLYLRRKCVSRRNTRCVGDCIPMRSHKLFDLINDSEERIKSGERILLNKSDTSPTQRPHQSGGRVSEILASEKERAAMDFQGPLLAHDAASKRCLARAGFADHAQCLPGGNRERHTIEHSMCPPGCKNSQGVDDESGRR